MLALLFASGKSICAIAGHTRGGTAVVPGLDECQMREEISLVGFKAVKKHVMIPNAVANA